ncbi:DUF2267 domain-containing protein [Parasphingopyxis lamellibrachiae]|uniref:Uncharacterized protein (DUF2267 family) n=1 Tax=Parasphingopyxis lamellibrachiae TaxID=680125 RepID=A0A3D9FFP8_9SPHN|nr:DUF2267 domain-containing protein [Parasphingopyxis lamellibrachiae]RED16650.1 uncharacterized protein (DUF2267 family) [Parasphingopyxis lamellibrachiae]
MSALGLRIFDKSVQDANVWLDEVMEQLGWDDKQRAYRLLRSTLHVLRDRIQLNENVQFAAQLPTLVRGIFYEGWQPSRPCTDQKRAADFIASVEAAFDTDPNADPEAAVRAAFAVIALHVSAGEIEDVKSSLPPGIRALWPAS